MKEISELLKKKDIRASGYRKFGNVVIADTNIGKVAIKKNKNKDYIYKYLDDRNFNYYPEILDKKNYIISKYIENIEKLINRSLYGDEVLSLVKEKCNGKKSWNNYLFPTQEWYS